MAYCTKDDLLKQISDEILIQLTDDYDAGVVDDSIVADHIASADAEIDGYCGLRYTLPFSPVPTIIKKLSVDITIYNLYGRRETVPESRSKDYDNAVKLLQNVAKGLVTLGADAPVETSTDTVKVSSEDRVFTREKLEGF